MSEPNPPYRPFANGVGIFIGIVILWAGSYGIFWLGRMVLATMLSGESETSG